MKKFKEVFIVAICVWYTLAITVTTVFSFSQINNLQTIDESVKDNRKVNSEETIELKEELPNEDTVEVPVDDESTIEITSDTEEVIHKLSIEDAVTNVLRGNYGNGEERKLNLSNLGFTPEEIKTIQRLVDEECATKSTTVSTVKEQVTNDTNENNNIEVSQEIYTNNGYIGNFKITGYSQEEGFIVGNRTASGIGCKPGICAMNNQRRKELGIKYGDSLYVEGLGTYTVADCGCSYNTIDIWVYTNAEAYSLTSHRNVYIVK